MANPKVKTTSIRSCILLQNLSIEFLAGIMKFDAETKKVTPDKRKGTFKCFIDENESKIIQWIPADSNLLTAEIELYVFPGDAKFKKVQKSSGRIYFLSFESFEDKYFFWMQETDQSKDDEYCQKVNKIINYDADEMEEEKINESQQQQQPQQQQQSQAPVATQQSQADYQKILSEQFTQALLEMAQQSQKKRTCQQLIKFYFSIAPTINDVIVPYFDEILKDDEMCQKLIPLLPPGQQTKEGLISNLKSPQFQQAVDQVETVKPNILQKYFKAILSEENVLLQLGIDISNIKDASDEIGALYQALINKYEKK